MSSLSVNSPRQMCVISAWYLTLVLMPGTLLPAPLSTGAANGHLAICAAAAPLMHPYAIMNNTPNQPRWHHPNKHLDLLRDLKKARVSPARYVSALAADRPGFRLPRLARQDLLRQAQLNMAGTYVPPRPPSDRAILLGVHPELGFPVELNISDMGHTIILGPTKSGKNNSAYQIGKGGLKLGRRFEVIGQKGDELNAVNLWPGGLYLTVQRYPWNDWTPQLLT